MKLYKNVKKIKKKKNNNSLKKIWVKTLIENSQTQQEKQIKDTANIYIKKMIKDLGDKTFKHHIYTKHYNITLDLAKSLKPKKTSNITFNKKL